VSIQNVTFFSRTSPNIVGIPFSVGGIMAIFNNNLLT
jgi:hypothetical protein